MTSINKLFVYGPCKKGFKFHNDYIGEAKFLGNVKTDGYYSLYVDVLPFMVKEASTTGVKGEVYEMKPEALDQIDSLVGIPFGVKREIIDVFDESGTKVIAWAYVWLNRYKGKKHIFKEIEWL